MTVRQGFTIDSIAGILPLPLWNATRELNARHLSSGGLITNYYCTSSCGHCLYRCSPRWEKKYIDQETTRQILQKVKDLGCHSLHKAEELFLEEECCGEEYLRYKSEVN